jgi:hypothetical protein
MMLFSGDSTETGEQPHPNYAIFLCVADFAATLILED